MFDPSPVTLQAVMDRFDAPLSTQEWVIGDAAQRERCHAVLLLAGRGRAQLRQGGLDFAAPALVWLPVGETQSFAMTAGAGGYVFSVSEDLVARYAGSGAGGLPLRFVADTVHAVTPEEDGPDLAGITQSFAAIHAELRRNTVGAGLVIGAYLQIILTGILRLADGMMERRDDQSPGSVTFQRFLQVLELHFREHWNVVDYARILGISERRLSSAAMRATGKPPLLLIHDRVIREACLRLEQSPLAVAQIAYGLGFRDPAYFSRFFKRYMGEAPGAYRRLKRAELRIRDDTFAAWP
ncbi:helix-turn-helix domain-containing protein [Thalassospira sp.]|uniref:helix-turn-helix domain-containing protein n=1 Tax=Thalassospira sp. TaxID=1912094 RepID=UPI00273316C9|nr:helix-turn-helix domain-containing protein [Thalassospira sp.]MDP2697517.1 helix-turn-helix domain-containing protein [Thalassospira sp.]